MSKSGAAGFIVPSGIATDDNTKYFFSHIVENGLLHSLFDFENRRNFFPGVGHGRYKFCLITLLGNDVEKRPEIDFVFFALDVADLDEQQKHFSLSAEELSLLNPNTRTCSIFRSKTDAELTKRVYESIPVLIKENDVDGNPWNISYSRMFDMSTDSHLFRTRAELSNSDYVLDLNTFRRKSDDTDILLPLYEAKMVHHFDHRWATYDSFGSNEKDPDTRDVSDSEKSNENFLVPCRDTGFPRMKYWLA